MITNDEERMGMLFKQVNDMRKDGSLFTLLGGVKTGANIIFTLGDCSVGRIMDQVQSNDESNIVALTNHDMTLEAVRFTKSGNASVPAINTLTSMEHVIRDMGQGLNIAYHDQGYRLEYRGSTQIQ